MKRKVVLVIASAFLLLPGLAAEPERSLILRGIIWIRDPTLPPIKMANFQRPAPYKEGVLLREGDREGMLSVESILPESGKVFLKDQATQQGIELRLPDAIAAPAEAPTFQFRSITIGNVVDLLQMLASRTIVAPASSLHQRISLTSPTLHSRSEAASVLEETVRTNGLVLQLRGKKFALLVPASGTNLLAAIPDPPVSEQSTNQILPPGLIKFIDAHVFQVLDFYQMLSGRTVIFPGRISGEVAIRTETALVHNEALWMMNAVLRLAGLVIVPEAQKFVFAVPPSMTNSLSRFDRKAALAKATKTTDAAPTPINVSTEYLDSILTFAAITLGREPQFPPAAGPRLGVTVFRTLPLDQAETIYALEAWANVNGLKFELIGRDKITVTEAASKP